MNEEPSCHHTRIRSAGRPSAPAAGNTGRARLGISEDGRKVLLQLMVGSKAGSPPHAVDPVLG
jgi:hypothetical protein